MNTALVKLVRKYEDRAERCKTRGVLKGYEYYSNAAKLVLALALQQ